MKPPYNHSAHRKKCLPLSSLPQSTEIHVFIPLSPPLTWTPHRLLVNKYIRSAHKRLWIIIAYDRNTKIIKLAHCLSTLPSLLISWIAETKPRKLLKDYATSEFIQISYAPHKNTNTEGSLALCLHPFLIVLFFSIFALRSLLFAYLPHMLNYVSTLWFDAHTLVLHMCTPFHTCTFSSDIMRRTIFESTKVQWASKYTLNLVRLIVFLIIDPEQMEQRLHTRNTQLNSNVVNMDMQAIIHRYMSRTSLVLRGLFCLHHR